MHLLQGGISSLGLGVSLLWTEAQRRKDGPAKQQFGISDIIRWTAEQTAARVGLDGSLGKLQVGMDASFAGASVRTDLTSVGSTALTLCFPRQSLTRRLASLCRRRADWSCDSAHLTSYD